MTTETDSINQAGRNTQSPSSMPDTHQARPRKAYSPPRLYRRGDIRDLTLGGSPGFNDSGNPGIQNLP
jgi:hypothetical protein